MRRTTMPYPTHLASLEPPHDRWDTLIEWLLIGLLAFMPLAFGAVEAWSEMIVILGAASLSVCFVLKLLLSRRSRIVWTWTYVPIALFLLFVVLQLLPLPTDLVARLSPQTVATRTSLLSDLAGDPAVDFDKTTLTFYPTATKHDLRLVLVAVTVFVVVVNVYRHPRQIKRLLTAIAMIGGGFATLALVQVVTGATKIYWTIETGDKSVATAGSFINYSNYSQFMNLSLGAALGLLLVRLEETARRESRSSPTLRSILRHLRSQHLGWLLAMIVLGSVTVLTSMSRNGVISLLVAATVTGVALASTRDLRWRGWLLATMSLVAFATLFFVGFDAVYDRMATLQDFEDRYAGRWEMNLGALAAWREYPVFGAGLGTHEVVFPMFDPAVNPSLAGHADNDYAQILEETGVLGVGLAAAFLAGIWWRYFRLIRRAKTPLAMAAFGLGFGLLAIMIHSTTDFGQHLPANFCLTAIACALLIRLGRIERDRSKNTDADKLQLRGPRRIRWLAVLPLVCLVAVWGWALLEANAARVAENEWAETLAIEYTVRQSDWQASDDQYADLITHAEAAAESQPDNVKYRYWLNVYRWQSISRDVDPDTGQVVLHPDTIPHVERIAQELANARLLCPTFGPVYSLEGQLKLFVLERPVGGELIRKGYQLAPNDASTCFIAGVYSAQEEDLEETISRFERAIALDGSYYGEVMGIYIHELNRPDLARRLAGDNCGRLFGLSNSLSRIEEHAALAQEIHADAVRILRKRCKSPEASASELARLASICQKDKDFPSAVTYYRRALNLNYGQVGWRLALAKALAETGQVEEAMHEARICLRLRPQMQAAKKLIEDLSVK